MFIVKVLPGEECWGEAVVGGGYPALSHSVLTGLPIGPVADLTASLRDF